jgi:hypothetical protein
MDNCFPGIYDPSSGDLAIQPEGDGVPAHAFIVHEISVEGDISVRVQGTKVGRGRLWFTVHWAQCGTTYLAGIVENGDLVLTRHDTGIVPAVHERTPIESLEDEDYVLQLDVLQFGEGRLLELRAWPESRQAGQPTALSMVDDTYGRGRVGLGHSRNEPDAFGVFRYVWISTRRITGTVGFIRGDCDGDKLLNLTDAIFLLDHLFMGGPEWTCEDACDTNADGAIDNPVDISDAVYLLDFLFLGGPVPPAPFPECGTEGGGKGCEIRCE